MATKKTFEDLFHDELRDMLDGERQITKALPKMIKGASSTELKEALQEHLTETEGQIVRLEKIFEICDFPVRAKTCEAVKGLLKEGEEMLEEEWTPSATGDAAIIAAAQKVEHYEIATYGTLKAFAETLGFDEAATLLGETLDEESDMDGRLNSCASAINAEAVEEVEA